MLLLTQERQRQSKDAGVAAVEHRIAAARSRARDRRVQQLRLYMPHTAGEEKHSKTAKHAPGYGRLIHGADSFTRVIQHLAPWFQDVCTHQGKVCGLHTAGRCQHCNEAIRHLWTLQRICMDLHMHKVGIT